MFETRHTRHPPRGQSTPSECTDILRNVKGLRTRVAGSPAGPSWRPISKYRIDFYLRLFITQR